MPRSSKSPSLGPLHPQQPGGEDREARLAGAHLRRVRGDRVARHADALEQRGGRLLSPHATAVSQTGPHGAERLAIISGWTSRACNAWRRTLIDKRGGTDALKADAEELKNIATGPGSASDKAKRAADALKDPGAKGPDRPRTRR